MTKPIVRNVRPEFKNETKDDKHILTLSGVVSEPSWFNEDTINSKYVRDSLDDVNQDVVIRLNSGGGDVFEGIEIYNYLKEIDNHVTIEITALAASAASLIAMAADKVVIRTGASMMIHEAATFAWGNKHDIQKTLNALNAIDDSIVDIYAERTGIKSDELQNLIKDETWFTADEAVTKGFADEKSSSKAIKEPSDKQKGGENVDNKKIAALLEKQQQSMAAVVALIKNEEVDPADPEEPEEDDKDIEDRVTDLETEVKSLKERLSELEPESNPEDPTNKVTNKEPKRRLYF